MQGAAVPVETMGGPGPRFQLMLIHNRRLVIVREALHFFRIPVKIHRMVLGAVVLILVQDPGGIGPERGRRPLEVCPDAGRKGLGGSRFIYQSRLFLFVGKAGVVGGLGLPLPVHFGAPAEFVRLVIQLENTLGKAVEHRLVIGDDAAFHSSQTGREVHIAGPLCP